MPRYAYRCGACNNEYLTMHASHDTLEVCEKCGSRDALTRLLTVPAYKIKQPMTEKVGTITEDFIEESRKDLKKQRGELHKKR